MNGLQITAVAAACGIAGFALGFGKDQGSVANEVINHERRITHHDARIDRIETAIVDLRISLNRLEQIEQDIQAIRRALLPTANGPR